MLQTGNQEETNSSLHFVKRLKAQLKHMSFSPTSACGTGIYVNKHGLKKSLSVTSQETKWLFFDLGEKSFVLCCEKNKFG